jgi:hypothetical protein
MSQEVHKPLEDILQGIMSSSPPDSGSGSGTMITIHLKHPLTDKNPLLETMEVSLNQTIGEFKEIISRITGVSTKSLQLIYDSQFLKDSNTFQEEKVKQDSTIHISVRLKNEADVEKVMNIKNSSSSGVEVLSKLHTKEETPQYVKKVGSFRTIHYDDGSHKIMYDVLEEKSLESIYKNSFDFKSGIDFIVNYVSLEPIYIIIMDDTILGGFSTESSGKVLSNIAYRGWESVSRILPTGEYNGNLTMITLEKPKVIFQDKKFFVLFEDSLVPVYSKEVEEKMIEHFKDFAYKLGKFHACMNAIKLCPYPVME